MERTVLSNLVEHDEDGEAYRVETWRKRMGIVQLNCPRCYRWFKLGKDFKVDKEGNVDSVVYHVCDAGDENDSEGWVVLPKLEGWR